MAASMSNLQSNDRSLTSEAFHHLHQLTDDQVNWAYEIWDRLRDDLRHKDNLRRVHAAQLLCNLAKSDPEGRIVGDLPLLWEITKDERFVTARHCIQAIWKIGLAGPKQKEKLLQGLTERFRDCREEKNWSLIRYDLIVDLRKLYDHEQDEAVKRLALDLIESEEDLKYRKKYASVWK
ncbi:hypothetical protein IDH41_22195 [Paenibacillus sp. IB182493]|uniref:Uncharacterized protein n=2 Tax=Paenibacillus arenilitoris TaxID=2772299 RepID=A0A927CPU7_9BACL|nr:hypothetical protein [Paenibacillus arenilitoris]